MQFLIEHKLNYEYDRAVALDPTIIRLQPRHDFSHGVLNFKMEISPEPTGQTEILDIYGNNANLIWFDENMKTQTLNISIRSEVETKLNNPYNFLLRPAASTLPIPYSDQRFQGSSTSHDQVLAPFLYRRIKSAAVDGLAEMIIKSISKDEVHNRIKEAVEDESHSESEIYIHEETSQDRKLAAHQVRTIDFLSKLTSYLAEKNTYQIRELGAPMPPDELIKNWNGSCRDLAMLFVDVCHAVGIAARFVSGYSYNDGLSPGENQLHAWAEVYLPGAGWRGYDPTLGLAVSDKHIPVACAADSFGAAPMEGTFRGEGIVESDFSFQLNITELAVAS